MSTQLHCDICDTVIGSSRGGNVTATPLHGWADGETPMDLCLPHYNSFKNIVREWKKYEQGFVPQWPGRAS